jgi:hypothetical protein
VPDAELGLLAMPLVAINPRLAGRAHAKVKTVAVRTPANIPCPAALPP